ncbi:site-specific DNA-methyltransferase [Brevibacterium aurantiacum]|uniref:Site-specific DNA-methyltransferase n=1 Tax=Brevibacterium aurantiacum TaxID=273384 RepID=A0A2A3YY91_BREAU|nr:DNA methyltransferase [Brevibacterium aurantiacum]PCC44762.1 site-specific DNA-methyltransferase [Brevibacterium aurantiacum]
MSRLTDLVRAAKQLDPSLGEDLEAEIRPLQKRLPFGLNFERHAPEAVELAGHKVRKGSKVRVLPPRGSTERGDQRIWRVDAITGDVARVSLLDGSQDDSVIVALEDLILVAEFRDRIYPGLQPDGTVGRGGDKPFHTVINGENFHVLEQLTFTHSGSVDAIYIDPPYNSGARDWKYNNDYVEGDDLYRHSKWLAFMERRLKLTKRLLKPTGSILIVTIDEKEYLRLGLLLEQTFPEAGIQMVSSVIAPGGQPRGNQMSRVEEYIFVVYIGDMKVGQDLRLADADSDGEPKVRKTVSWENLIRRGTSARRQDRENQFYPFFVDPESGRIIDIGEPLLPKSTPRSSVPVPPGQEIVWPIRSDGSEGRWRISSSASRKLLERGFVRTGRLNKSTGQRAMNYVLRSDVARIEAGEIEVAGRAEDGSAILERISAESSVAGTPKTVWNRESHNAGNYGTALVRRMLPGRAFPFPKSLYAVEDVLRLFVKNKPDAVILDFFAGSGTTAHAVMRLNKQDNGRRQCISVTNNEVSAEEQAQLRNQGLRPGDEAWEELGICEYVTKPRLRSAIDGRTPEGEPIKGEYKFADESSMSEGFDENAAFFTLTYESPWRVSTDRAFAAIAPMLWLRAGAVGRRIDSLSTGWDVSDSYGIINDLDQSAQFIAELERSEGVRIAYVVTDDEGRYQQIANEIPHLETVRLYEDYLRNCESVGDY